MDEYIEREALKQSLLEKGFYPAIVRSVVKSIPAADVVEVRYGEWIEGKTLEKCSICGKKGFPDWRYCPHCGAKTYRKDGTK